MTDQATRNVSLEQMDMDSTLHPYTALDEHLKNGPERIVESGNGIYITDTQGRTYIDAMASLFCVNVGYGRTEIADAISEQAHKMAYFHTFVGNANEPQILLADRLLNGLLPKNMSKILFASSGSEANDANIKLAWNYQVFRGKPKKRKIIAREMGYHGVTVMGASLSGLPIMHQAFGLPLDFVIYTDKPHYYWYGNPGESELDYSKRLAKNLDELIEREDPETVCAFIAEPVMGAGASVSPPEGYFQEIQKVLDKHDVLFIADEVITGFGRLGTWIAADFYGFEPDLMTLSKGITSAYMPSSASVVSKKVWDVVSAPHPEMPMFASGSTASGHPIACAAALACLDIYENENLIDNAKVVGKYFKDQLIARTGDHPLMGEIRGEGLMLATELVADKDTKEVLDLEWDCSHRLFDLCLEEMLITRGFFGHNSTSFAPPLTINKSEVDDTIDRFERGLNKLADELVADGRWKPKN